MEELSQNILDIAMNSVAVKSGNIDIFLTEDTALSTLEISIRDNGPGMSEETVAKVTDPFYTSRKTRKVGLGIPFFKMQAEMTGGSFRLDSELGRGTAVTAVFRTDHLDFIPVGNLPETMMTLVGAAPNTEITMTYSRDGKEVTFDTKEIRAVLGEDIPLDTPQVLIWIRDSLAEELSAL